MKSPLFLICLSVVLCCTGCSTTPAHVGNYLRYEYVAQVLAMPSCRATMEFESPCARRFRTASGREFVIGGPGAEREVAGFLATLEEGKSYYLPKAFMEYREAQQKNPN